jgi:hypothetical protein
VILSAGDQCDTEYKVAMTTCITRREPATAPECFMADLNSENPGVLLRFLVDLEIFPELL